MKKIIVACIALGILIFIAGCSAFEGRPEENNTNQARGSWVWMNNRLDEEEGAEELDGRFGDQSSADANDERPAGINLDATFPGMKSN
jgi:hypothetical protein